MTRVIFLNEVNKAVL